MHILSLETSGRNFSLAVSSKGKILACRRIRLKGVLSSSIIPSIKAILKKALVTFERLDGFAIGLGPGSFTSLRVGLSTVKALGLTAQKPVVGVSSLDVLAMNIKGNHARQICTLCDAKRNLFYCCFYKKKGGRLKRLSGYLLIDLKSLLKRIREDTIFVGDGIAFLPEEIKKARREIFSFAPEKDWYPSARNLAFLAYERFRSRDFDDIDRLVPIYVYPDDCQIAKKI